MIDWLPLFDLPTTFTGNSPRLRHRAHIKRHIILAANAALTSLNSLRAKLRHSVPNLFDHFLASSTNASVNASTPPLSLWGSLSRHPSAPMFNSAQAERIRQLVYVSSCIFVRRAQAGSGGDVQTADSTPITCYSDPSSVAIPLDADKIALPETAGVVNLLDVLPPALADRLRAPSPAFVTRDEPTRSVAALLNCSHGEYLRLLQRMSAASMLDFTTAPKVVNGIFAVDKDNGAAQRLIVNAIPANSVFAEPPHTDLPNPEHIAALVLEHAARLYVAKCDISNYYHQILLPEWLRPFFALPSVRRRDLGLPGDPEERVWPCCRTMPMGWSWSVFLAQQAHLHILSSSPEFPASAAIDRHTDPFLNRPRFMVYIDDIAFFASDELACRRMQDAYIAICARWRLPIKPAKMVRPSLNGVEVLGVLVHGARRSVGVAPEKLARLVQRTVALLHRGFATGAELERLLGSWSWAFLVRRPAFAVFSSCYRFAAIARHRLFCIWPTVRDELLIAAGLAPLLTASLDAPMLGRVVASDASNTGLGVAAARSDVSVVWSLAASLPRQPVPQIDDVAVERLQALPWRTIASARWTRSEHIAVAEARAASTAARWVASLPSSAGARVLLLLDSSAVAGALSKGRSSQFVILRTLRRISAIALAHNITFIVRWIPSHLNAADGPSRA